MTTFNPSVSSSLPPKHPMIEPEVHSNPPMARAQPLQMIEPGADSIFKPSLLPPHLARMALANILAGGSPLPSLLPRIPLQVSSVPSTLPPQAPALNHGSNRSHHWWNAENTRRMLVLLQQMSYKEAATELQRTMPGVTYRSLEARVAWLKREGNPLESLKGTVSFSAKDRSELVALFDAYMAKQRES